MCFAVRTALADGTMDKRAQDTLVAMGKRFYRFFPQGSA